MVQDILVEFDSFGNSIVNVLSFCSADISSEFSEMVLYDSEPMYAVTGMQCYVRGMSGRLSVSTLGVGVQMALQVLV
jgi:hypothetical protein